MNLRRMILAIALVVLAALLAFVSTTPLSGTGQLVLLGIAAGCLVAVAALFVWRRLGSVLTFLAGAAAGLMGAILAGLAGLGNSQPTTEVLAMTYLGGATALVALVDLAAIVFGRRPSSA